MQAVFRVVDTEVPAPFPRLTYDEAMARYGSDKPDLRFEMPIRDVSEVFREGRFKVFRELVAGAGRCARWWFRAPDVSRARRSTTSSKRRWPWARRDSSGCGSRRRAPSRARS